MNLAEIKFWGSKGETFWHLWGAKGSHGRLLNRKVSVFRCLNVVKCWKRMRMWGFT